MHRTHGRRPSRAVLSEFGEPSKDPDGTTKLSQIEIPADGAGLFAGLVGAGLAAAIGLSGGLVLTVAGLVWSIFASSWQSRLAHKLAESLSQSDLREQFDREIARHWSERQARFRAESERLETSHLRQLELRGELLERARTDTRVLGARRHALELQLGFFMGLPPVASHLRRSGAAALPAHARVSGHHDEARGPRD